MEIFFSAHRLHACYVWSAQGSVMKRVSCPVHEETQIGEPSPNVPKVPEYLCSRMWFFVAGITIMFWDGIPHNSTYRTLGIEHDIPMEQSSTSSIQTDMLPSAIARFRV